MTYAASGAALMLYLHGFVRLRRRRRSLAPAWAAWSFACGIAVGIGALASPLDRRAESGSLLAHMVQHLLLGDVAPILIAAGLIGPRALFAVPRPALRLLARAPRTRHVVRWLVRPPIALAAWIAAQYAWHVPALYDVATGATAVHVAEHASFFVSGFLVWRIVLDGRRSAGRRAAFAGAILLAGMPVAEVLIASAPLYAHYPSASGQLHAGLAMMAEQVATLGFAALVLLRAHVERVAPMVANP